MAIATSLTVLSACNDDTVPTSTTRRPADRVEVTPKARTLAVGATAQLSAEVFDGRANKINKTISWSSSDETVVTVSNAGLVTAVGVGNGSVIASTPEGARSSASFTVTPAAAAATSVVVSGPTNVLSVGSARQLSAMAMDASGRPVNTDISWTSSAPTVASVNNAGVVIGLAEGPVTITASAGGASGTLTFNSAFLANSIAITPDLTTVAPGTSTQLTATPRDGRGVAIPGRTITWSLITQNGTTLSNNGMLTIPEDALGGSVVSASTTDAGGTVSTQVGVNPLRNATNIAGLTGPSTANWSWYFFVPSGTTAVTFTLSGGTGDPDLYVYRPNTTAVGCAAESNAGITETCTFTTTVTPGWWRVRVQGWTAFQNWTLRGVTTP